MSKHFVVTLTPTTNAQPFITLVSSLATKLIGTLPPTVLFTGFLENPERLTFFVSDDAEFSAEDVKNKLAITEGRTVAIRECNETEHRELKVNPPVEAMATLLNSFESHHQIAPTFFRNMTQRHQHFLQISSELISCCGAQAQDPFTSPKTWDAVQRLLTLEYIFLHRCLEAPSSTAKFGDFTQRFCDVMVSNNDDGKFRSISFSFVLTLPFEQARDAQRRVLQNATKKVVARALSATTSQSEQQLISAIQVADNKNSELTLLVHVDQLLTTKSIAEEVRIGLYESGLTRFVTLQSLYFKNLPISLIETSSSRNESDVLNLVMRTFVKDLNDSFPILDYTYLRNMGRFTGHVPKEVIASFVRNHRETFKAVITSVYYPTVTERLNWLVYIGALSSLLTKETVDFLLDDYFIREVISLKADDDVSRLLKITAGLMYFTRRNIVFGPVSAVHLLKLFTVAITINQPPSGLLVLFNYFIGLISRFSPAIVVKQFYPLIVKFIERLDINQKLPFEYACNILSQSIIDGNVPLTTDAAKLVAASDVRMFAKLKRDERERIERTLYNCANYFSPDRFVEILYQLRDSTAAQLAAVPKDTFFDAYKVRFDALHDSVPLEARTFQFFDILLTQLARACRDVDPPAIASDLGATVCAFIVFSFRNHQQVFPQANSYLRQFENAVRDVLARVDRSDAATLNKLRSSLHNIETLLLAMAYGFSSLRCAIWSNYSWWYRARNNRIVGVLRTHKIPLMAIAVRNKEAFVGEHQKGQSLSFRDYPTFGNPALALMLLRDTFESKNTRSLFEYFDSGVFAEFADGTTRVHLAALSGDQNFASANGADQRDAHGMTPLYLFTCFHGTYVSVNNIASRVFLNDYINGIPCNEKTFMMYRVFLHYVQRNLSQLGNTVLPNLIVSAVEAGDSQHLDIRLLRLMADIAVAFIETRTDESVVSEDGLYRGLRMVIAHVFAEFFKSTPVSDELLERIPLYLINNQIHRERSDNEQVLLRAVIDYEIAQRVTKPCEDDIRIIIDTGIDDINRAESFGDRDDIIVDIDDQLKRLCRDHKIENMLQSTLMTMFNAIELIFTHAPKNKKIHVVTIRQIMLDAFNANIRKNEIAYRAVKLLLLMLEIDIQNGADEKSIRTARNQIETLRTDYKKSITDSERYETYSRLREIEAARGQTASSKAEPAIKVQKSARNLKKLSELPQASVATSSNVLSKKHVDELRDFLKKFVFSEHQVETCTTTDNTVEVASYPNDIDDELRTRLARVGFSIKKEGTKLVLRHDGKTSKFHDDDWKSIFEDWKNPTIKAETQIAATTVVITTAPKKSEETQCGTEKTNAVDPIAVLNAMELIRTAVATLLRCDTDNVRGNWIDERPFEKDNTRAANKIRFVIRSENNGFTVHEKRQVKAKSVIDALIAAFAACGVDLGGLKASEQDGLYVLDQKPLRALIKDSANDKSRRLIAAFEKLFEKIPSCSVTSFAQHTMSILKPASSIAAKSEVSTSSSIPFAQWRTLFSLRTPPSILDEAIVFHLQRARLAAAALDNNESDTQRCTRLYIFHVFCAVNSVNERQRNSSAIHTIDVDALRQTLRHHIDQMPFEKFSENTQALFTQLARCNDPSHTNDVAIDEKSIAANITFLAALTERLNKKLTVDIKRGQTELAHLKMLLCEQETLSVDDIFDAALSCWVIHESTLRCPESIHGLLNTISGVVGHDAAMLLAKQSSTYDLLTLLRDPIEALRVELLAHDTRHRPSVATLDR